MKEHIRWMIRRDMPEVMEIERLSDLYPWSEEQFLIALRQRNCIGMVVERDDLRSDLIVGFTIYELHRERIEVLKLAVHSTYRRHGVGLAIVDKLKGKLSPQRRRALVFDARESMTDAHFFLRECGFLASEVIREHFPDSGEDAYRFGYETEKVFQPTE